MPVCMLLWQADIHVRMIVHVVPFFALMIQYKWEVTLVFAEL